MKRFLLLMLLGFTAVTALAAEKGVMRYSADLMAAPFRDAKVVTTLKEKQRLEVTERKGAWLSITTDDRKFKGWVRLHQVSVGDGTLTQVRNTGRSGSSGLVATTGIRGLQAAQLKDAKPNEAEVQKLNSYRVDDAQAREHARERGLKETQVSELPNPNAPSQDSP